MFENLLTEFTSSSQGQGALSALTAKGFSQDDASKFINEALPAAKAHFEGKVTGSPKPEVGLFSMFGGHAASSFLIGLTEGIVRGESVLDSIEDGGISLLAGHIADVVAPKLNIDSDKASIGAAVAAPFIVHFAHEKLAAKN